MRIPMREGSDCICIWVGMSYIHLATCGIPISHHILHILVRLLIPHRGKVSYMTMYLFKEYACPPDSCSRLVVHAPLII